MAKAWRDAGLLDVEQDSLMIRMEFSSFADFWTSLDGKDGPYAEYLVTLSAKKKSKLRDAVEQHISTVIRMDLDPMRRRHGQ